MREVDKQLAEALRLDDESLFAAAGDPSIFDELAGTFRGRRRWLVVFAWVWGAAFAVLMFAGLIMFFRAETDNARLTWGFVALLGLITNGLIKVWYWMEMNRHTMLRELKRVEFQVARLADRLPEPGSRPSTPDTRG